MLFISRLWNKLEDKLSIAFVVTNTVLMKDIQIQSANFVLKMKILNVEVILK